MEKVQGRKHSGVWGVLLYRAGEWVVKSGRWRSSRRPYVYGIRYSRDELVFDCQREGDGVWISVRAPLDAISMSEKERALVEQNTQEQREKKNAAARAERIRLRAYRAQQLKKHADEWRREDMDIRRRIWRMRPWCEWGEWIYIDVETTGLSGSASVLSCAIIDDEGNEFYDFFRPRRIGRGWPAAERINGITPMRVRRKEVFADWLKTSGVAELFPGRHVVIYNAEFDEMFFPTSMMSSAAGVWCAMRAAACAWGQWSDYWKSFKWPKLWDVVPKEFRNTWNGLEHTALADVYAAREVWHELQVRWGLVMHGRDIEDECEKPDAEYDGIVFDPANPSSQRFRMVFDGYGGYVFDRNSIPF